MWLSRGLFGVVQGCVRVSLGWGVFFRVVLDCFGFGPGGGGWLRGLLGV